MSLPIQLGHAVLLTEVFLTAVLISWLLSTRGGRSMPARALFKALFCGAIIALIAAYVTLQYRFDISALEVSHPDLIAQAKGWLITANVLWASAVEELAKYVVGVFTLVSIKHNRARLSDTIIAMIVVGLGFSLIEDALFILDPSTNAPFRLLSFYLHSGTSAIIGYSLGRFRFGLTGYRELFRAVIAAILLHAIYNLSTALQPSDLRTYLTFAVIFFITIQVFILFRKTLEDEAKLQTRVRPKQVPTHLLNLKPEPKKAD